MKHKEPWKPIKPKTKPRCHHCNGTGKVELYSFFGGSNGSINCLKCGGKGYI